MFLRRILNKIKEYIFPIYCLDCGEEGFWLCENCYKKLDLLGRFFCPVCHLFTSEGQCCQKCVSTSYLDKEVAILEYSDQKIIGQIIHNLKYNYVEDLEVLLSKIIKDFVNLRPDLFTNIEQIIPVPLHKKRYVERGFNQAGIIAKILSQELSLPINRDLQRIKYTQQQAKLNKEERQNNIRDVFIFQNKLSGVVLLVDDVFTTGSTIQACAKVLKESGAQKVIGFTVARG